MDRFDVLYKETVIKKLQAEFNYKNKMEVPKISKICINMGVGEAVKDSKIINNAVNDLTLISGQNLQLVINFTQITITKYMNTQ